MRTDVVGATLSLAVVGGLLWFGKSGDPAHAADQGLPLAVKAATTVACDIHSDEMIPHSPNSLISQQVERSVTRLAANLYEVHSGTIRLDFQGDTVVSRYVCEVAQTGPEQWEVRTFRLAPALPK